METLWSTVDWEPVEGRGPSPTLRAPATTESRLVPPYPRSLNWRVATSTSAFLVAVENCWRRPAPRTLGRLVSSLSACERVMSGV